MSGPRCLYCGDPIRKETETFWFGQMAQSSDRLHEVRPKTVAEAQRHVNGRIVSHSYSADYADETKKHGRFIQKVSAWDGESYVDPFFCNGRHARLFGVKAAEAGYRLVGKS